MLIERSKTLDFCPNHAQEFDLCLCRKMYCYPAGHFPWAHALRAVALSTHALPACVQSSVPNTPDVLIKELLETITLLCVVIILPSHNRLYNSYHQRSIYFTACLFNSYFPISLPFLLAKPRQFYLPTISTTPSFFSLSSCPHSPSELVFLNLYGAQESMPRHQFRQPI